MKTSHYFIPIGLAKVKKYGSSQFGLECGEMDIVMLYFWWKYKLFHFEEQFGGCHIESVCTFRKFLHIFTRDRHKNGFCGPVYINKFLEITKYCIGVNCGKFITGTLGII